MGRATMYQANSLPSLQPAGNVPVELKRRPTAMSLGDIQATVSHDYNPALHLSVLSDRTPATIAANPRIKVRQGDVVQLIEQLGQWIRAQTPGGTEGYFPALCVGREQTAYDMEKNVIADSLNLALLNKSMRTFHREYKQQKALKDKAAEAARIEAERKAEEERIAEEARKALEEREAEQLAKPPCLIGFFKAERSQLQAIRAEDVHAQRLKHLPLKQRKAELQRLKTAVVMRNMQKPEWHNR